MAQIIERNDFQIISGRCKGTFVFIPRIDLSPAEDGKSFPFSRHQFPVRLAFALTINKCQLLINYLKFHKWKFSNHIFRGKRLILSEFIWMALYFRMVNFMLPFQEHEILKASKFKLTMVVEKKLEILYIKAYWNKCTLLIIDYCQEKTIISFISWDKTKARRAWAAKRDF